MSETLTLDQCEQVYMDGCADEISGDVEAPMGHFYRVGRFIVTTDSQGFHSLSEYADEETAHYEFEQAAVAYAEWDSWNDDA
jgi:hypothetical protein